MGLRGNGSGIGIPVLALQFQRLVYLSDLNVDRNHRLMIYNLHVKFSGH